MSKNAIPTEEVVQESVDSFYAKIDSEAVVLEVLRNPTQEFVEKYNRDNDSRLRFCPAETKVGWIRENGDFHAPVSGNTPTAQDE